MAKEVIDNLELKIYKEKPYKNSNGDPFGVTLNGRAKDYIQAHHKFRDLIKKGKVYDVEYKIDAKQQLKKGKIRFLSVIATKSIIDSTVEVVSQEGVRGNVQLKSYFPSNNKKKGASTELRKLPDYEYCQVEVLRAIVTNLLDKFIAGDHLPEEVKDSSKDSVKDSAGKDVILSCDLCSYKTKFQSGLKSHKTKMHKANNKCLFCEFSSVEKRVLEEHTENIHTKNDEVKKRPAPFFQCPKHDCGSTFVSEVKLNEHEQSQHSESDQTDQFEGAKKSPSSSPSRKKAVASNTVNKDILEEIIIEDVDDTSGDEMLVDMDEKEEMSEKIDQTNNLKIQQEIQSKLLMKIKQLELIIQKEKEEKQNMKLEMEKIKSKTSTESNSVYNGKQSKKPFKIPNHLKSVFDKHLSRLGGFRMRYCAIPDGACLTNCLTAHISCTEDKEERKINNTRVNHHIADNFDNYYQNKITLPYAETVGVGANRRQVEYKTKEEFKTFLYSEKSLCVFSNSQELIAIANMLNITVRIFTYGIGGDAERSEWKEISPDPELASTAHFPKGLVPDLYLYNSDQAHYDLLVAEDHRLALLGLIGSPNNDKEKKETTNDDNGWQFVNNKKKKCQFSPDSLIVENDQEEYDEVDLEELDEEVNLARAKKRGHRRTNPSSPSESVFLNENLFPCSWTNCKMQLESEGLLDAHLKEHKPVYQCEKCVETYTCEEDLKEHNNSKHFKREWTCDVCKNEFSKMSELREHRISKHGDKQWNCDGCSFQAHSSDELIKHLKLTGHQPSQQILDSKSKISRCYTCKEEFTSYWNLMNHRKQKHPSNRTCRYFLKQQCVHGIDCWYRHDEPMDTDSGPNMSSSTDYNCQSCNEKFDNWNSLRNHKRKEDSSSILCYKFLEGKCDRGVQDCEYKHVPKDTQK